METKEKYEELKNKYDLPNYDELENDFELGSIEDNQILRAIRKKIGDKIDFLHHFLDNFIQPDTMYSSLHEIDAFNDSDREKLIALYKKIMMLHRELIKLNLNFGEEADAKFIKGFYEQWDELKKEIIYFIEKAQNSWCTDDIKGFNIDYLG